MKQIYSVLLAFLLSVNCFTPLCYAFSLSDTTETGGFVSDYIKKNGLPGASIVVVTKNDGTIYADGIGHDSNGEPLTENSLMRIASGSKPFTAFAVLQLVDDGKIELDEPVLKYLPGFMIDDSRWELVTVRQLLSHTSGLPDPIIVPPAYSLLERVDSLRRWKLQSQPGEKYSYANPNYWLLAYLVQEVSGLEFPEYLLQRILQPLGMNNTFTAINSGDSIEGLADGHISAYGMAFTWTELEQMFVGAGGMVSTAEDMGKWLSMLLNNGKNEAGEQLLSEHLLNEAFLPQRGSERYGLGWQFSSPDVEPARIGHSGVLKTFESRQDIVLSGGYAVAVMLNSFTITKEQAYEVSSGIIEIMEGNSPSIAMPTPIIIDLSLGFSTLLYIALGIKRIVRSKKWTDKRKDFPAWRFYARLFPQLVPVIGIGWLFLVVPILENNSSNIKDAFGLWFSAMLFLATTFVVELILIIRRVCYRAHKEI